MKCKIVFVGAGSRYCEEVLGELATTPELAGASLVLMDVSRRTMDLMEQVGRRMFQQTGLDIALSSTTDMNRAPDGADFVISSIGVHGEGMRFHKKDVLACAKLGIIHTTGDTVGPSGISQGLRIVPLYVDLARRMGKYCPAATLLNHSNPMMAICRAVTKYSKINVLGYCHNVEGDRHWLGELLGIPGAELDVTVAGPNHMSWLISITHKGKDVYPQVKRRLRALPPQPTHIFSLEMLEMFDLLPIGGDRHIVEFFPHARLPKTPKELRYEFMFRADMIDQRYPQRELNKIPGQLLRRARGLDPVRLPTERSPESMPEQILAIGFGREKMHFISTPNRGAVPNLPDWSVLELKCLVGTGGARPVYVGDMPIQAARWSIAQIYASEVMIEAAVEGSRHKAIQALACDPMIANFREPEPVLDALIAAQGPRLARFAKKRVY